MAERMGRPGEEDREAVERAFQDLVAGYHLTAERPDPGPSTVLPGSTGADWSTANPDEGDQHGSDRHGVDPRWPDPQPVDQHWADLHPLFRGPEPAETDRGGQPDSELDRFVPPPAPPLPRPAAAVLAAWLGIAFAVVVVMAAAFGLPLPRWMGWGAGIGFVGGFALLVVRLPRHRPPDAGDGAVL